MSYRVKALPSLFTLSLHAEKEQTPQKSRIGEELSSRRHIINFKPQKKIAQRTRTPTSLLAMSRPALPSILRSEGKVKSINRFYESNDVPESRSKSRGRNIDLEGVKMLEK
jgi:hypothetical protein